MDGFIFLTVDKVEGILVMFVWHSLFQAREMKKPRFILTRVLVRLVFGSLWVFKPYTNVPCAKPWVPQLGR